MKLVVSQTLVLRAFGSERLADFGLVQRLPRLCLLARSGHLLSSM